MKLVVDYAIRDTPLPDEFNFPYRAEPGDTLIRPHQTIGTNHAVILDDDLLAVQNGTKFFYLWGTITYGDVFEGTPHHSTEFCTQITRVVGNPLDPGDPAIGPKATSVEITFGRAPRKISPYGVMTGVRVRSAVDRSILGLSSRLPEVAAGFSCWWLDRLNSRDPTRGAPVHLAAAAILSRQTKRRML
jgi:hypothetical protein